MKTTFGSLVEGFLRLSYSDNCIGKCPWLGFVSFHFLESGDNIRKYAWKAFRSKVKLTTVYLNVLDLDWYLSISLKVKTTFINLIERFPETKLKRQLYSYMSLAWIWHISVSLKVKTTLVSLVERVSGVELNWQLYTWMSLTWIGIFLFVWGIVSAQGRRFIYVRLCSIDYLSSPNHPWAGQLDWNVIDHRQ